MAAGLMTDREATMPGRKRQSREERLRKQREYQRAYNRRIAKARAPDDPARLGSRAGGLRLCP
jgi:hypothetical protein